jgi:hypothetical protein
MRVDAPLSSLSWIAEVTYILLNNSFQKKAKASSEKATAVAEVESRVNRGSNLIYHAISVRAIYYEHFWTKPNGSVVNSN